MRDIMVTKARNGDAFIYERWSVSSIVSLGISDVLESKRLDEKFGMPFWTHAHDMSPNAS